MATELTDKEKMMLAKLIVKLGVEPVMGWKITDALALFRKLGLTLKFGAVEEENAS